MSLGAGFSARRTQLPYWFSTFDVASPSPGRPIYNADFSAMTGAHMTANSTQHQSNQAKLQHDLSLEMAASETGRHSANLDRLDTSLLVAKLHAARSADKFMIPQTIFRTPDTSGWWHTNSLARVLTKAEVFATILPSRYFQ
jgi:hypothetical protein